MNVSANSKDPSLRDELSSAFDWWREAGVDYTFTDDATAWLREPGEPRDKEAPQPADERLSSSKREAPEVAERRKPTEPARIDFFAGNPPQSLEEFREFWLSSPGLDTIGPRGRVAPRGSAQPEIMVLVVDPEPSDSDILLSGPQGRLLDRILAAMGFSEKQTYLASALPRHTPMADTHSLAASGLDAVLHHHIALVAPKRLIAFGAGLAPFLGPDLETGVRDSQQVKPSVRLPDALTCEGLDSLMNMPRLKARFWRRWIEWTATHD
ncbi:MAG: uracil-DNA glycosylase family protein [Pseudomonadota bacterium]